MILYEENQTMSKGFMLGLFVTVLLLVFALPPFLTWATDTPPSKDTFPYFGFSWIIMVVLGVVFLGAVYVLFYLIRIHTVATDEALKARFYPWQGHYHVFPWKEIDRIEVKHYHPKRQFGGWGVRMGFDGTLAITMQGEEGIYVHLKDGQSFLIGTRTPDKWREVITHKKFPPNEAGAPITTTPPEDPSKPIKPIPPVSPV